MKRRGHLRASREFLPGQERSLFFAEAALLGAVPAENAAAAFRAGRVAERLGERERAIQSYPWVVGMWRNADPELQPYVREVREGVVRLTGEKQ